MGAGSGSDAEKIAGVAGYGTNVNEYSLSQTIGRVIKILLSFVGTIFFALAVYAGFLWMTAQGNEDQVAKATGIIKTAVIGLIVVMAAYSITAFALIFSAQTNQFSQNVGGQQNSPSDGGSGSGNTPECESWGYTCRMNQCDDGEALRGNLGEMGCGSNQVCCD